ncbi:MAG: type V CRISPR-associated protein Cas12a/Cpf1 [Clostridia bacterium]|nr:type V CRISPR-associated protein Cas12a/Cpf1 [Clostridia bacterium]
MKKIDSFINKYPLTKTLRFSLIPVGKTEENFNNALLLKKDKQRGEDYKKVKEYIDRYHKEFIEKVLSKVYLEDVKEYADLYYNDSKTDKESERMKSLEDNMRKVISKAFKNDKIYSSLFKKDLIEDVLPRFLENNEEKKLVESFQNFFGYFGGFNKNRENMYTEKARSTAIAYRCINDNLPKFLDNSLTFNKVKELLSKEDLSLMDKTCMELYGVYVYDVFMLDYFNFTLSQSGIGKYNSIIGGYVTDEGVKIKGLNEYIDLYNKQVEKNDKSKKLPFMKKLYKQILIDNEKISFIPESFESGNSVIHSINTYFTDHLDTAIKEVGALFEKFEEFNMDGVFLKAGNAITDISNHVFGDWSAISKSWNAEYEEVHPIKKAKDIEKYFENERKEYNKVKSFAILRLQRLGEKFKTESAPGDIVKFYKNSVKEKIEAVLKEYNNSRDFLKTDYNANNTKKLYRNEDKIKIIKELLDSVKELEHLIKPLLGTGKESGKDEVFYGEFLQAYEQISLVDGLYDRVRNYITQKPYSANKIKLNFDNPQFLKGWPTSLEIERSAQILLTENNEYYLAVINKEYNSIIRKGYNNPADKDDVMMKMCYEQMASPSKDIPNLMFVNGVAKKVNGRKDSDGINRRLENEKTKNLPTEVNDIRLRCGYSVNLNNATRDEVTRFIDYYIKVTEGYYNNFKFNFKKASEYSSYSEFVSDADNQAYQINFQMISKNQISDYVEKGYLYLFRIYNKDFSEHSHGNPNLHTLYFKMLFDEKNLADVVYQLSGGAEMFYREAKIDKDEMIVHKANEPIKNKNKSNPKKESVFKYDLIKDERFTKNQFSLHLPITLNFKADGQKFINSDVRQALKNADSNYVIGIDRGERNLLYICVIDNNGKIIYQKSLNEIISGKDKDYKVDYHKLLDSKENDRDDARKSWRTIENIKELKEGYLSQVVHEICNLVLKYDAIIAMEDLNFGFKKGRFKVEKQVYQKFENMLISKLNFLVSKSAKPEENGGLLNAYQLTNKVDGVNKAKQNGFIFYVPAWLTSKIDPVTGFADLLKPRYTNITESKTLVENIDDIRYNPNDNMFEFDIDYEKFPKAFASYRKLWTVYTNGERIINYHNKDKNNQWDNKTIVLTEEFKALFDKYGIDYSNNLKEQIISQTTSEFFKDFIRLFANTLQMRNSETGNGDVDYLISPVKDECGNFYDSRNFVGEESQLPENADANGAYNIARKAQWAISVLKNTSEDDLKKEVKSIKNSQWLEYVQK